MVQQKEMVRLENWLNRKMVKWKNGKMEILLKQKTWLKGKIRLMGKLIKWKNQLKRKIN